MASAFRHVEKLASLRVLAASQGFRDAAKRLGVAPSTLSERIAALEKIFRRPLVERGERPVLTPFARELVDSAASALDVLEGLVPEKAGGRKARVLRVGAYESLALRSLVRAVMGQQQAIAPEIHVSSGRGNALVRALVAGELDAVVTAGPLDDDRVDTFVVGTEELCVTRPKDLPERDAYEALRAGTWVGLRRPADSRRDYVARFLAMLGASRPRFTCDSFEVAARLSLEGGMPAVLPTQVARDFAADLRVLTLEPAVVSQGRHDILLVVKTGLFAPHHDALRTRLERALGESARGKGALPSAR